jgi:hypothetical protein
VTHLPEDDSVQGLADRLDPYMRRMLDGSEDPRAIAGQLMLMLTEPPYFEHLWGVGRLYQIWGELSDVVDGWPVDHGPDSAAIAVGGFRQAAQHWLAMPHTVAGLRDYITQWEARVASMLTAGPETS